MNFEVSREEYDEISNYMLQRPYKRGVKYNYAMTLKLKKTVKPELKQAPKPRGIRKPD